MRLKHLLLLLAVLLIGENYLALAQETTEPTKTETKKGKDKKEKKKKEKKEKEKKEKKEKEPKAEKVKKEKPEKEKKEKEPKAEKVKEEKPEKEKKEKRERPPYVVNKLPSIGVGVGPISFFGDIDNRNSYFKYHQMRYGYSLRIEERIWSALGVSLGGLYGQVSESQRDNLTYKNFESTIMHGELDVILYLDNNLFINRASRFSPYLFGGVGYMMFEPKGDFLNEDGKPYILWEDGTIRTELPDETTISHIDPNSPDYNRTNFDGDYETALDFAYGDSATYEKTSLTIPVGVGLRYKLSDKFNFDVRGTFVLTQTDYLDNFKVGDGSIMDNDQFLYTEINLSYNLGSKTPGKEPSVYDDVSFDGIDDGDDDGDGVPNMTDQCADTPDGVPVDENGCPPDMDLDGVPDYKDEEPNSPVGAIVDINGITIGEEAVLVKDDTLAAQRKHLKEVYPSSAPEPVGQYHKFEEVKTGSKVDLGEFREVDLNNDGYISADEISNAIDAFFDGELDYTASKLHSLIDFFFDQ